MFTVKSLESGRWWDSASREARGVKKGDLVEFAERRDAEHFIATGRAEWCMSGEVKTAAPVAKKAPKANAKKAPAKQDDED